MKRTLFFLAGFLWVAGFGAAELKAADLPEATPEKAKSEAIRPMEENYLKNRVNELERKTSQLEQDIRFLEDGIRNLERRVDDLRQRH